MLHVFPVNGYGGGTVNVGVLYFCSQQGERSVNIEGLASSLFGTSSFLWNSKVLQGAGMSRKGNKNILRFGERKMGLIISSLILFS